MTTDQDKTKEEAQIRGLVENWVAAFRVKDLEKLMTLYAPDVLVFDLAPPLQISGTDTHRKNWKEWFAGIEGPIGYEVRDLKITTGDGAAFSHSLNRITLQKTSGEKADLWLRVTVGYHKIDGRWLVTHEHVSVPFYMDGSFKAAVDLQP